MILLKDYIKEVNNNLNADQKRDLNWLTENLPKTLSESQSRKLKKDVNQLKQGKPLAYIMGYTPFFNTKIYVNENTLIPRQETELLVDIIVKKYKNYKNTPKILDLCSGSGAMAVSISKALNTKVDAVEINANCCKMIQKNVEENGAFVNIINSNMFEKVCSKYDLIISNPPYIETNEINMLDESVKNYEPHLALDGGKDGLDFYRIIAKESAKFLKDNGELALEIGCKQGESVKKLLENDFYDIKIQKDYSKLQRFVFAKKRWKNDWKIKGI